MWVLDIAVHDSLPRDAPIPEVPVVVSRMRVFLRAGEWKVGRSSGKCQIIVDQKSISREQFKLQVYELEPEQVTDVTTVQRIELITEKATTTQLDGVMLPMEQRLELKEGSRIVVGLKGAEIILHQVPMIICTSSKYKKPPLMEALAKIKEAARALGAHVSNKWTDQMTYYVPDDPVMASVTVLRAIMLQKPLVSVKWVTEKLANFDVGTALPNYEEELPNYGGNFRLRKPLADRSKLMEHIHVVAVFKEELLDVLVLAGVTISRAYELDDESFETEDFLLATGEGRYCVALQPLDILVKPHMKEPVARRLQHLRNKGIRITNTSKVAGAIVGCLGLKAEDDKNIGPSGEGASQATGASIAPDQSIALAPSQTQDFTQMPPPPPQAPRKAKPGPADQKKAARQPADSKEQTGSQASQSTVVASPPEKDKATKGHRKAVMVDESPQESPAKVNGSGGSGKRRRSRGGKEEEEEVGIVEKEEAKDKGKGKGKRRRGEGEEQEQADVVVVDGEEEEDKAGDTARGKRRRQKEEKETDPKGMEEAEAAKANEPAAPSPSPTRPRRGKKAEEQKAESQDKEEEMEVDGPPPTNPMATESPPPPASSGKKRKTPTPAKGEEKTGGKENGVWGTGEKARSTQPVTAGQGGSQLSQASQSQRSRYSSRPREAKRGEEQGWMMSQSRVAWQANGGLGRLASQPSQTQPVHWPVSKEERRRAAAVEDLGPREEEEDEEEFPMGKSQYEARDLVVKPFLSQAATQLTPASQYDGSQFLPDFRRFRKNHVRRTSQDDVVTRNWLKASAPKESEQQLRLADDEEEQREREREQEALFEEGGGKAKPAKAGAAAGGRRRKW